MVKVVLASDVVSGSLEFCWTMSRNASAPEVRPRSLIVSGTVAVGTPAAKVIEEALVIKIIVRIINSLVVHRTDIDYGRLARVCTRDRERDCTRVFIKR